MTDEVEKILALMMLGNGLELQDLLARPNGHELFDKHVMALALRFAIRDGKMLNYRRNWMKWQRLRHQGRPFMAGAIDKIKPQTRRRKQAA